MLAAFERFKQMKLSEVVNGRKQDLLTWIHGHRQNAQTAEDSEATPQKFSFNSDLLSPYFRNMALDDTTLPFIEFSTIGLIKAPTSFTYSSSNLNELITKFLNKEAPYQNVSGDYAELPLIFQVNNRYFLYGNHKGSEWRITELDASLLSGQHLPFTIEGFQLEYDRQHFSIYHHILEKKGHTHFSTLPQQVLQLQKIINSTFYIQALLREAEGLEFSWGGMFQLSASAYKYLNGTTYTNIYRAITFLSETELNVSHRFQAEITEFLQVLERFKRYSTWKKNKLSACHHLVEKFKTYTQLNAEQNAQFLQKLQEFQLETTLSAEETAELQNVIAQYQTMRNNDADSTRAFLVVLKTFQRFLGRDYHPELSFQAGHAAGFAIRHMYSEDGQWDANVFSQFSADLPRHLDMLTTLINSNNSSITQYAPHINGEQLRALQKEATQLLKTLKQTKRLANGSSLNPLYQMYKIINYAFLIQKIFRLLSTTLTQVGQLNEAYQEALRDILKLIKEECIPLIWKHAAHLEVEFILKPGTLTVPVLSYINTYFSLLTDNIKNLGDFKFLGEHLLVVEDSEFIQKCDDILQNMQQESAIAQEQIIWANDANELFFRKITSGDNAPISLQTHYAWLSPYVEQIDPQLDITLIRALKSSQSFNPQPELMASLYTRLKAHLTKLQNTEELRAQQCEAMRRTLTNHTNLQLFPYQNLTGCNITLKIVENTPLNKLKLPQSYPILIQHHFRSEVSYVFYGNTNGTKWGFTPINEAYLHRGILNHFSEIRVYTHKHPDAREYQHILHYKVKYESLYLQMILKKAHTHFKSPFCSMESEVLTDTQESLTQWIFKPIDWLEKQRETGTTPAAQAPTADTAPQPKAVFINQYHDHYFDLTQLTPGQALRLHSWYQQKANAYYEAVRNLPKFKVLMLQHVHNGVIQYDEQRSDAWKECQYLYHSIRPYLINMENFPAFDYKMVRVLLQQTTLSATEFQQKIEPVSLHNEQGVIRAWQGRADELLKYTQRKLQYTNIQTMLDKPRHIVPDPRAAFLFKTTTLSTKIHEFNQALHGWTHLLNPIIRDSLQPQDNGVPYPDILDQNEQQRQAPFILFFKRTFNTVYYLENLILGLEHIRTGDTEEIKNETIKLLQELGTSHGKGLLDIGLQLGQDPTVRKIYEDMFEQYRQIVDSVGNLIQPYTTDIQTIYPHQKEVTSSGLMRTLGAFFILPEHLLHLTSQDRGDHNLGYQIHLQEDNNDILRPPRLQRLTLIRHENQYFLYCNGQGHDWRLRKLPRELVQTLDIDFTQTSLDYNRHYQPLYDYLNQNRYHQTVLSNLQMSAKKATLNIEQIIKDSNRYFKLFFLDARMIYQLNQVLQAQAKLFTRTTQEVALSHLQILETDYLSVLLVKADTKEHEWGLDSGTLTEPMTAVLRELFQGLIFPLKMSFAEKEALCTNNSILTARIVAETQRFNTLSAPMDENATTELAHFDLFTQKLTSFVATYKRAWTKPPIPHTLAQNYTDHIRTKLDQYRITFIPNWIKEIPLNLDRHSLPVILAQMTRYYEHLTMLALLHNAEQKQLYEAIPIFLQRLKACSQTAGTGAIPAELVTQYSLDFAPQLQKQRISYYPDWLKDITPVLNAESLETVLGQTNTYYAHLNGVQNTRVLYRNLSQQKLTYLNQKLAEHNDSSRQHYRQSFAKHAFHAFINRLPYQALGLVEGKVRREYQRELSKYLLQLEAECLHEIERQPNIDELIEQKLKDKMSVFERQYFDRFQRLDRIQTAISEFKSCIKRDSRLPALLRLQKMNCLNAMEDIIYQKPDECTVDDFLNHRGQLLCEMIPSSEKLLTKQHKQFYTIFAWLMDCIFSFLELIGLYTPEPQRCYNKLSKATVLGQPVPTGWAARLSMFSLSSSTSTPPRGQIATPGATPLRPN